MASYFTTTFTPAMLGRRGLRFEGEDVDKGYFLFLLADAQKKGELVPAVGHRNTAELLRKKFLLSFDPYKRINLALEEGDEVLAAIPLFRPPQSREFTDEEIARAEFRYYVVHVYRVDDDPPNMEI